MDNRRMHTQLVKDVEDGRLANAVELAASDKLYAEPRSALLKKMELATALYDANRMCQALSEFDSAKSLADELYTKSLSRMTLSALDLNQAEFYGANYERSQIRFYQSLVHYRIYQNGKCEARNKQPEQILSDNERRFHLNAAKAVMVEWNSIFAQLRAETAGRPEYKADLTERLWGAFVHEQTDDDGDRQIALGLYKDGREVLLKNYNIYPAFNKKAESFAGNFSRLPNMDIEKVKADYIDPTVAQMLLLAYIDSRIEKLQSNKPDNVVIMVKDGLITGKKAREVTQRFVSLYFGSNANAFQFTLSYLSPQFVFDVPYVERKSAPEINAALTCGDGQKQTLNLALVNPLSDIAYKEIDDAIPTEKAKLIGALAVKYAAAAISAYEIYKRNQGPLGTFAAIASYKTAEAGIMASSKADLRQWRLLPSNVRLASATVQPGRCRLELTSGTRHLADKEVEVKRDGITFIDLNVI